jgi:hypothetical protein
MSISHERGGVVGGGSGTGLTSIHCSFYAG